MIIYNPNDYLQGRDRLNTAKKVLDTIPVKYAFITGSFLFSDKYNDVDVFIITRSKKNISLPKGMTLTKMDFNDLHSLFFHSVSKTCIAKNILPKKELKVTISDYWEVINEAVPTIMNEKDNFRKWIRFLVLYTEYFKSRYVLDSYELKEKINEFKDYRKALEFIKENIPEIISMNMKKSYAKRFFYTMAGFYKDDMGYDSLTYLYELSHKILRIA